LAAEEKYRGIFDHLVEGIFQTTPDGHYRMANVALARIYGYGSPEELQQSVTDIGRKLYVEPHRREEFQSTMDEHDTITGLSRRFTARTEPRSGFQKIAVPFEISRASCSTMRARSKTSRNRRAAVEELRGSESLYHSLVETMPQNVFRKDRQGAHFCQQAVLPALRLRAEGHSGQNRFRLFPKDLAEQYKADDEWVMTTGQSREITEVHHPLGQKSGISQVVKTPLYGADGTIIGLQGIFWDITKEREMEEKLRTSEALYHSLVETLPQNIFRKDLAGRFTFGNQQFLQTLGRTLEEIVGKTDYDFFPPEMAAKFQADDRQVVETGEMLNIVEENRPPAVATRFMCRWSKRPCAAWAEKSSACREFFGISQHRGWSPNNKSALPTPNWRASREQLRVKNVQMEDDLKTARGNSASVVAARCCDRTERVSIHAPLFSGGNGGGDFFNITALSEIEGGGIHLRCRRAWRPLGARHGNDSRHLWKNCVHWPQPG
jgi:PAS domain S-box-containing protein